MNLIAYKYVDIILKQFYKVKSILKAHHDMLKLVNRLMNEYVAFKANEFDFIAFWQTSIFAFQHEKSDECKLAQNMNTFKYKH